MAFPCAENLAVRLADGRVLVAGQRNVATEGDRTPTAEIYDPATDRWTTTGPTGVPSGCCNPKGVLLPDGRVLTTLGTSNQWNLKGGGPTLYDPATDAWSRLPAAPWATPLRFRCCRPETWKPADSGSSSGAICGSALPLVIDGRYVLARTCREVTMTATDTALVLTDPQNDFLSTEGVAWELVSASVEENGTVEHIEQLLVAAKAGGYPVFVSPHFYYTTDHAWRFGGTLEKKMHEIGMFDRSSPLTGEGLPGSGADWLERYKPYLDDGETVITSPHKVYGPQNNDLALQLRKRGVSKVVLAGMSANLCIESHLRDLLEGGFEVTVARDATAAANHPDLGDGYAAAITNFGYIANAVVSTDDAVRDHLQR